MDHFYLKSRNYLRNMPVMPDRQTCPLCSKKHKIKKEGDMHFFVCKKNKNARFFVGWDNVMMVDPPSNNTERLFF